MAYYLTIQKGKNEYKEINISSLNEFKRLSKYKDSYSLEEIDMFTSMFVDEVNLKEILYDNGLICLEDISKEISEQEDLIIPTLSDKQKEIFDKLNQLESEKNELVNKNTFVYAYKLATRLIIESLSEHKKED